MPVRYRSVHADAANPPLICRTVGRAAALGVLLCGGCQSFWREVPADSQSKPNVRLDASWYLENPSTDVLQRVSKDRREHIEETLAARSAGRTSIPLRQAMAASSSAPTSPTNAPVRKPARIDLKKRPAVSPEQRDSSLAGSESASFSLEPQMSRQVSEVSPENLDAETVHPLVIELADGRKVVR